MRATWQFLAVLAAVVFVMYVPSWEHGFLYDDKALLTSLPEKNQPVDYLREAVQVSPQGEWAPVARLTLLGQRRLESGLDPAPFRAVNIVLLALVGWAAFGLMRQSPLMGRRLPSFLGALLLVTHPVASASIYHIFEGRANLLALVLVLGSAAFYLRGGWWRLGVATVFFALALGCSAQVLWFPLVLAAAEAVKLAGQHGPEGDHHRHGPSLLKVIPPKDDGKKHWLRLIPLLAVTVLYGALRKTVLTGVPDLSAINVRMPLMEALYAWQALAAPQRAAVYQPALATWMNGWRVLAGLGLFALLTAAVTVTFHHPDATPLSRRKDELRRLTFWGAWLLAGMLSAMGMFSKGPLFDERNVLVFSVAVWGLLAWCITRFWEFELFRREAMVVGIGAAIVLGAISLGRRDYYKDDETFVSQWAKTNPEAWQAYSRRSRAWEKAGQGAVAEQELERGLMLQGDSVELLEHKAALQWEKGRFEDALGTVQNLSADYPTNIAYRIQIGDLNLKLGRFKETIDLFTELTDANPGNEEIKLRLEAAKAAEQAALKDETKSP